jgi:hypothetical protein
MSLKDVYSSHLMGKYGGRGTGALDQGPEYTFKRADKFNLQAK